MTEECGSVGSCLLPASDTVLSRQLVICTDTCVTFLSSHFLKDMKWNILRERGKFQIATLSSRKVVRTQFLNQDHGPVLEFTRMSNTPTQTRAHVCAYVCISKETRKTLGHRQTRKIFPTISLLDEQGCFISVVQQDHFWVCRKAQKSLCESINQTVCLW